MRVVLSIFLLAIGTMFQLSVGMGAEPLLTDGKFGLHLREQAPTIAGEQVTKPMVRSESWDPEATAFIVCDVWDLHHCYNAVQRVKDMAPRMNEVLNAARDAGALIIHSPSSCMEPYSGHPARRRAQQAPVADNLPDQINEWCHQIPTEEKGTYPLDQSDGGEDDDPDVHLKWEKELADAGKNPRAPWTHQYDVIEIDDRDAITDNGVEVWNLLESRGIDNVILLGVHTNMCVLGRPFGLRQLSKNGRNVVLMRDLTDTMYNPASWPYVNHHTGTDLIVEHIEKYVCPTMLSTDIIGGQPHRFFDDHRPTVAVIVSEFEYETYETLPAFSHQFLGRDFRVTYLVNDDIENHDLPGIEILEGADLAILSIWRRTLPPDQLQVVRDYVAAQKPLIAIRTSCHAFATRSGEIPAGRATWPRFDQDVLAGNYHGHHGNRVAKGDPATHAWILDSAQEHPLIAGLPTGEFPVGSALYKTEPLQPHAIPLLMGRVEDRQPHEPLAWVVDSNEASRVFFTSLGSPRDFHQQEFVRLLLNGVYWAMEMDAPVELVAAVGDVKR